MDICFVRPSSITTLEGIGDDAEPPLGIAYLAATMESLGHNVTVVDACGEAIGRYTPVSDIPKALRHGLSNTEIIERIPEVPQVIGVSCMFSLEWLTTRTLINDIRKKFPQAKIVAGGEHITAMPDYVLRDCPAIDFCVVGEGEQTLADLVHCLETGNKISDVDGLVYLDGQALVRTQSRKRVRQLDAIPSPAWHLIPIENYLDQGVMSGINFGRSMPIMASRGCPYRCTFCSNPKMWGPLWRARSPSEVLDEIQEYMDRYEATNFDFYDLTAIVKRSWIVDFCSLILERGMKFTWQFPSGTRTDALDSEITDLLNRSGCAFITYAPESGSPATLKRIKKQIERPKMLRSMRDAVQNGLNVKASFLLGFPAESIRDVMATFGFIAQSAIVGIKDVSVFAFVAYPGTELFDMLTERGDIEVNDDYFKSLVRGTAAVPSIDQPCWSEHYSTRALKYFCLSGLALFYFISFILRPIRVVRVAKGVYRNAPQTRLERSLVNLLSRRQKTKKAIPLGEHATP